MLRRQVALRIGKREFAGPSALCDPICKSSEKGRGDPNVLRRVLLAHLAKLGGDPRNAGSARPNTLTPTIIK